MVERILLIDTCTEHGFTAVSQQGDIVFQAFLGDAFDSAQALLPILQQQLNENAIQLDETDAIAVTVGPGSYTGLRVGVIVAKTLAFALNKPLIGIPSLELYAPSGMPEGRFVALIDARMGGVYGAIGDMRDGIPHFQPPFSQPIDELPALLDGIQTIVSPHALRLQERSMLLRNLDWHQAQPSAKLMEYAAMRRWKQGVYSEDGSVEILYLRKTQAEIEREKKEIAAKLESNP